MASALSALPWPRAIARVGVLAPFAVAALAACPGAAPPRPLEPSLQPPSASASVAAAPPAAASAEPPGPGDAGEPPAPPARERAAGSTRQTIACGKARCKAGAEACSWDERAHDWRCTGRDEEGGGDHFGCDDASDCGAGEACCETFASASTWVGCLKRREVRRDCRAELCVEGDGARCPPGQACSKGYCESTAPKPPTRCGAGLTCRGATPLCQWRGGRGACVARADAVSPDADNEVSLYGCTRPADCPGGEACCASPLLGLREAYCGTACDRSSQQVLCETDADCRRVFCAGLEDEPRCRKAVRCVADDRPGAEPPWAKSCQMR